MYAAWLRYRSESVADRVSRLRRPSISAASQNRPQSGSSPRARRSFSLSAEPLEVSELEGLVDQCHCSLGGLAGAIRAVGQGIADQPHLGREVRSPLTNRFEEGVEHCGELLLDFDVPDSAAAIPLLEVGHLLTVEVERLVVQKHWIAFDMAGIGRSESRRIRVH